MVGWLMAAVRFVTDRFRLPEPDFPVPPVDGIADRAEAELKELEERLEAYRRRAQLMSRERRR